MKIMTFIKLIIPFIIGSAFCEIYAENPPTQACFDPTGYWLTEPEAGKDGTKSHGAKVEIYKCGTCFCGRIFSVKDPLDSKTGKPPVGKNNKPIIGMEFVFDMAPNKDEPNKWSGGTIYDSREGQTYTAYITMTDNAQLHLRGYVLGIPLLGRTTVWTRTTRDAKY